MTFIEMMVVMAVMTVAVSMFTSMVMATARQRGINRENAIAANAARTKIELMRNEEFLEIFRLFNQDKSDDPDGAGTGPGHRFFVYGLDPLPGNPDGLVGQINFPVIEVQGTGKGKSKGWIYLDDGGAAGFEMGGGGGLEFGGGGFGGGSALQAMGAGGGGGGGGAGVKTYQLREDYVDARMGMPRDLNGDNFIDDLDHVEDYIVLPVHIEIEWRGRFGPRRLDLYSQIAAFHE